jgi:hypothetical protein
MTQPVWRAEPQVGMWVKLPPTRLPTGTVTLPPRIMADTICLRSFAFGSILFCSSRINMAAALRVPDEDDRTPVVVVRHVVLPPRQEALVGHLVGAGSDFAQPGDGAPGDTWVPTPGTPGRNATPGPSRRDLGRLHLEVGVRGRLGRNRRVHVEAVELGRVVGEAASTLVAPPALTAVDARSTCTGRWPVRACTATPCPMVRCCASPSSPSAARPMRDPDTASTRSTRPGYRHRQMPQSDLLPSQPLRSSPDPDGSVRCTEMRSLIDCLTPAGYVPFVPADGRWANRVVATASCCGEPGRPVTRTWPTVRNSQIVPAVSLNQKIAVGVVFVSAMFMNIMDITIVNVAPRRSGATSTSLPPPWTGS